MGGYTYFGVERMNLKKARSFKVNISIPYREKDEVLFVSGDILVEAENLGGAEKEAERIIRNIGVSEVTINKVEESE